MANNNYSVIIDLKKLEEESSDSLVDPMDGGEDYRYGGE